MRLFDLNGPLMSALGKLADICICNVMFVLFSIPIFTMGASLAALNTCMQSLVYDEEDGIILVAFWNAFRKNFGQSTLMWLTCLGALVFFVAYGFVLSVMTGMLSRVYWVTFYLLLFVYLLGAQYIFALQARYCNRIKFTLRNSWLIAVAALPWSLLGLVIPAAAVYVSFLMNPNAYTAAIFIWAVCGFGVVVYINTFFYRMAFRKITPEMIAPADEDDHDDEALFTDEEHRRDDIMIQQSTFSNPDWNRREEAKPSETGGKRKRRK